VEGVVLTLALLLVLHTMAEQMFPLPMRMTKTVAKRAWRIVKTATWSGPVRRWGRLWTLFGWSVVATAAATVLAISQPGSDTLGAACIAGIGSVGLWLVTRWWARRRFATRPLPTRVRR
jgi:hypothetical protein